MKKIIGILLTFLLFITASSVSAQTVMQGDSVVVPANRIIDENYFAGGESVTMSGTVNGDAYIAGGTVYVDGIVNGDLLVGGGTININGTVNGDIRAAGGQINISGIVAGNITVAGGNINISEDATIAKGLVGAGGQMNIMAPLGGGLVAGAGQLTVNNVVNGNVLAGVGTLVLTPKSQVEGTLTYYSEERATIAEGAVVSGAIDYHQQQTYKPERDNERVKEAAMKGAAAFAVMYIIYSFIVSFIVGAIFIKLAPRFMQQTADTITKSPWTSMGIGLLTVIVVPIIAFILLLTIIGIPFSFFTMFIYILYMCVSKIFVALYAGEKIAGWFNWSRNMYVMVLVGLLALTILTSIPVLGWLLQFIVTIAGIGALLMTKKAFYTQLRSKNLL